MSVHTSRGLHKQANSGPDQQNPHRGAHYRQAYRGANPGSDLCCAVQTKVTTFAGELPPEYVSILVEWH